MYVVARGILPEHGQAVVAAALFTVLPPFPGYLFVAYPEIVVAFVFLAGIAVLVHARGPWRSGARGRALRGRAPSFARRCSWPRLSTSCACRRACAGAPSRRRRRRRSLLVVVPFARDRAVHPNALYPSVVEEALRTDRPLVALAKAVTGERRSPTCAPPHGWIRPRGPRTRCWSSSRCWWSAAAIGARRLPPDGRRLALATLASLALLTAAVLALYVVRERGGVWGGVRAYMAWMPLLLVFATPLLFAPRSPRLHRGLDRRRGGGGAVRSTSGRCASSIATRAPTSRTRPAPPPYLSRYLDAYQPHRIAARSFLYGLEHYPVEVIWSLPRDGRELAALNQAISYEFLAVHEKSPLRSVLLDNPRYVRINKEDRGAEFLIWRRLY